MKWTLTLAWLLTASSAAHGADLPLKDGDRIIFAGDSIADQKMFPCYIASYLILSHPSLNLHAQIVARGGISLESWLDSGDPNYEEYSKNVYALKPQYVFIAGSDNGGFTRERHKAAMSKLVNDYIVGRSGAIPLLIGMMPTVSVDGYYMGGEFDDANEEIALAATPHYIYDKTWHAFSPSFKQNYIFTADAASDTLTSVGHGLTNGLKVLLEMTSNPPGPGGLTNFTLYYVRDVTSSTFQLATTPTGPAVDITSNGSGTQRISYAWPLLRTKLNDWDHPAVPGQIGYAWTLINGLGFDTNVSSASINAGNRTVLTNVQCTVSSVTTNTYGGIDFVRLDKRLPWAIDEKGRADALFLYPAMDRWQNYTLTVTGLSQGTYEVFIDSARAATLSSAQLAIGWNMADLTTGPVWEQAQEVLGRIRDMHGIDRVTLLSKGSPWQGMELYRSNARAGYQPTNNLRGDALVAYLQPAINAVNQLDDRIHQAAQPLPRTYSIRKLAGTRPAAPLGFKVATQ